MRKLIFAFALVAWASCVHAQNASTTITSTNTFQQVYASNPTRIGCTIQNNGTHNMQVFFGPIASATLTNTITVTPTNVVYCNFASGLTSGSLGFQVSITGTSGDAFYALQW